MNSWILTGGLVAFGPQKSEKLDIEIRSGKIKSMDSLIRQRGNSCRLNLEGCLILPGLINAHDHLEFNLFPRLGNGPYQNSGDWARDIYHPNQPPIKDHLGIPLATRLQWGAVKNLLSGVTTVCHHNRYYRSIFSKNCAVGVPHQYGWAHSFEFSPNLATQFMQTPREWPFILHLGEAVDACGRQEILRLDALGALDSRTVLVHAVALDQAGLQLARARGASIVWCPSSNMFVLGKTLSMDAFKGGIRIGLGTDSAITGEGDLLDEIRFAHRVRKIRPSRLYDMVTKESAQIMKLEEGQGRIIPGGTADLLVVKDSAGSPAAALLKLHSGTMELVFARGEIKLASPAFIKQVPRTLSSAMHMIEIEGVKRSRAFIAVDLRALFRNVEPILGPVVLAHKRVKNP